MPLRVSLLFSVTTQAAQPTDASAHSGGWSESHWTNQSGNLLTSYIIPLAQARAATLSSLVSIIGYRIEEFTILGNKLQPGGATSGRFQYPGGFGNTLNLPQDALQISASANGAINSTRFTLRGMPDSQILQGEYTPTTGYKTAMNNYLSTLPGVFWGFIGRVKSNPVASVNKIVGNVVTLSQNVGGVEGQSYLRLNRVYDSTGSPVRGAYLITDIAANVYTLAGLPGVGNGSPSGTARIDAIAFYAYLTCTPSRAVTRKIGRPFEQYRGRRSGRRKT